MGNLVPLPSEEDIKKCYNEQPYSRPILKALFPTVFPEKVPRIRKTVPPTKFVTLENQYDVETLVNARRDDEK